METEALSVSIHWVLGDIAHIHSTPFPPFPTHTHTAATFGNTLRSGTDFMKCVMAKGNAKLANLHRSYLMTHTFVIKGDSESQSVFILK